MKRRGTDDNIIFTKDYIKIRIFSTMMYQRVENPEELKNRYEFVGRVAPEEIRKKYKDKSVANIFSKGEQNPIRYILK